MMRKRIACPNNDILAHLKNEESLVKVFKKVMQFVQHIKIRAYCNLQIVISCISEHVVAE